MVHCWGWKNSRIPDVTTRAYNACSLLERSIHTAYGYLKEFRTVLLASVRHRTLHNNVSIKVVTQEIVFKTLVTELILSASAL